VLLALPAAFVWLGFYVTSVLTSSLLTVLYKLLALPAAFCVARFLCHTCIDFFSIDCFIEEVSDGF